MDTLSSAMKLLGNESACGKASTYAKASADKSADKSAHELSVPSKNVNH